MSDCPKLLGGFMYELVNEKHPLTKTHFKDIFVTLESVRARDAWIAEKLNISVFREWTVQDSLRGIVITEKDYQDIKEVLRVLSEAKKP